MSSEQGKGMLGLLFAVLIVFIIAYFSVPWLQRVGIRPDEAAAVEMLKRIHAAQADHFGASRMYGSLAKLTNSKLMNQSSDDFKSGGYEFSHSASGGGRSWCAMAAPEQGKPGRRFGIDADGTVYENVSVNACYMGTLDKAFGSVVK